MRADTKRESPVLRLGGCGESGQSRETHPTAAKAAMIFEALSARINPCPDTSCIFEAVFCATSEAFTLIRRTIPGLKAQGFVAFIQGPEGPCSFRKG